MNGQRARRRSLLHGSSLALAAALALHGCTPPTAPRPTFAYDPTTLSRGLLYRWPTGRVIYVWAPEETISSTPSLSLAVRQAIATWNTVPSFAEFTLASTTRVSEANIVVYDRAAPLPIVPSGCAFDPQGSGYTYLCPSVVDPAVAQRFALASGAASAVSVVIRVDRVRVADQAAFGRLIAHEVGHALGIGGHSDRPSDLMFGSPLVDAPSDADAQTLRYLLGRRADLTL